MARFNDDSMDAAYLRVREAIKHHALELFERDGYLQTICILGTWVDSHESEPPRFAFAMLMADGHGEDATGLQIEFVFTAREAAKKLRSDMVFLVAGMLGMEYECIDHASTMHAAACAECEAAGLPVIEDERGLKIPSVVEKDITDDAIPLLLLHSELRGTKYGIVYKPSEVDGRLVIDERLEWEELHDNASNLWILPETVAGGGN